MSALKSYALTLIAINVFCILVAVGIQLLGSIMGWGLVAGAVIVSIISVIETRKSR